MAKSIVTPQKLSPSSSDSQIRRFVKQNSRITTF